MSDQLKARTFCYEDWRSDQMNNMTNRNMDVPEVNYCLDLLDELYGILSTPPRWTPIEDAGEWGDEKADTDLLRGKIRKALGKYRCQHVCDYDGDSLGLNDALANAGEYETISEADAELDLLADYLASEIDPAPPPFNPEDYEVKP